MLNNFHTNQRLMLEELIKRGATYTIIDKFDELLSIEYNGKKDFLLDRFSSKAPFHVVKVSADKYLSKNILKENKISVPTGSVFTGKDMNDALTYAKDLYPVVLKPNWGSHGNHVQVDIRNSVELESAIWQFQTLCGREEPFIIERYYPWMEHRVFITLKGEYAVVKREPASIVGDGVHTIQELVEIENNYRIELKKRQPTSLCPLVLDTEVDKNLFKQHLNLEYVPQKNEKIFLRCESNLAKGGRAINMTPFIDKSVIEVAKKALSSFPFLPCAGLDVLCEDITKPFTKDNYTIIEINSNPGLAMHTYPTEGESINVAKMMVNVMFEELFKS